MTAAPPRIEYLLLAPALEYSASVLYALTLASGLVARGRAVRLVTPGGRFEALFRERGIPLDIQPFQSPFPRGPFARWRLLRDLRGRGVRVVHALSSLTAGAAMGIARRLGVPAVVTVHRRASQLSLAPETDWSGMRSIITFSEDLRADVVNNRRAPKEIVRVIPAGVVAQGGVRPPFDRADAVPIVGTLGDADKIEAQMHFIGAAAAVLARRSSVEFLVVSGGAEPRSLRALARELGVASSVTFTTLLETHKALPIMDICVLPGAEEGPAQAILEAMAAGRPVITTGVGGAYGVIQDEVSGLIVDKGDQASIAAAILRLAQDRELARRLGEQARDAVAERFPLDRMLDETLAVYDETLRA